MSERSSSFSSMSAFKPLYYLYRGIIKFLKICFVSCVESATFCFRKGGSDIGEMVFLNFKGGMLRAVRAVLTDFDKFSVTVLVVDFSKGEMPLNVLLNIAG